MHIENRAGNTIARDEVDKAISNLINWKASGHNNCHKNRTYKESIIPTACQKCDFSVTQKRDFENCLNDRKITLLQDGLEQQLLEPPSGKERENQLV